MENYTLTTKRVPDLARAFILEAGSIDRLLVNPGRKLLGVERMNAAYEATTTWCRALWEQGFLPRDAQQICTMTVLAEGIGHNLPAALANALAPQQQRGDNFIGVSRFTLAKSENDAYVPFDARVKYLRIESPAPVWVMLDTIATGATLVRGLEAAFANAAKPREILLGAPAGSLVGAKKNRGTVCPRKRFHHLFLFRRNLWLVARWHRAPLVSPRHHFFRHAAR